MNPADTRLYVAAGSVFVIDTATNALVTTVGGFSNAESVAVHPNGSRVYVTGGCTGGNGGGNFAVIDTGSNAVIACLLIVYGNSAPATLGLAVHPDGSKVFVAHTAPLGIGVSIIDTATNAVTGSISTGGACFNVAVHPDGKWLYGACQDPVEPIGSIVTIDLASNAVAARVPACFYPAHPGGLAVDPEGTHVFAASAFCDALWVIDTATNAVSRILPLPSGSAPRGLAIGPTATTTTSTTTSTSTTTPKPPTTTTTATSTTATTTTTLLTTLPPAACPDAQAAAAVEAAIEAQCNCRGAANHRAFVRCATRLAKASTLPKRCKRAAIHCAARSVCGKPGFVTCCRTTAKGKTTCGTKSSAAHCKATRHGTACVGQRPSCCDACVSGGCAASSAAHTKVL